MSGSSARPRVIADRYVLRTVLGSGSMGTVWAGYDEVLRRNVAVKELRLPADVPSDIAADLRERTLREARAIAVLAHPNVVVLHDVARDEGEPFVVMELLTGRSLAGILHGPGPLNTAQAAAVADAVAAALEAAHEAGITHRDVKPGNVLIGSGGQIKLTDFGVARNVSEQTMTSSGIMLGSPAYIAPEVASGSLVTPAADLWGLGATLYAAVEGTPPYDVDGDPLETVGRVVHGEVPRPSAGPLAEVITGLMAKDPESRTPLSRVRERLFPLLDAPVHNLFGPELLERSTSEQAAPRPETTATQVLRPSPQRAEPQPSTELAGDPGPLPFTPARMPTEPPSSRLRGSPRRGAARNTALTVISILLFALALAGGFTAVRAVGGAPVLPSRTSPGPGVRNDPETPSFDLVTRHGDATNIRGARGGRFTISVPREWTRFVAQRPPRLELPRSTVVEFVSPDGNRALSVRRFVKFFPGHGMRRYLSSLRKRWPNLVPVDIRDYDPADRDNGRLTISYRTVRRTAPRSWATGPRLDRTTTARLLRHGNNLWVISVTVPTARKTAGRSELFEPIVETFEILR